MAAPLLGEHTREVLRKTLGYDDRRIAALAEAGAFGKTGQYRLSGGDLRQGRRSQTPPPAESRLFSCTSGRGAGTRGHEVPLC